MALLPQFQDDSLPFQLMQNKWAGILNPVISNPITQGTILKDISLVWGDNTINHRQGHALNGYIIVGMRDGSADIYDSGSQTPSITLVLNANASCTVDIYVF